MKRRLFLPALVAALVATQSGLALRAQTPQVTIATLSTRADLVTGGDVLLEVRLPQALAQQDVRILRDDADVTAMLTRVEPTRLVGLVTGLRDGENTITATVDGRMLATLPVTSHPRGGPLFSGPQLEPWECSTTAEPSLGPAQDAQCNAPTQFRFVYRSTSGRFQPWDPASPVPADVEQLPAPGGGTMPYIVRIERGTLNRGIHEIAVLHAPGRGWDPLAPPEFWGRKLLLKFGGGTGQQYRQGTPVPVLDDNALRRGFAVASSSMLVNGQHANFITAAETALMLKEHIIETYGLLRYTIGEGGSGGALLQYLIADAYPGILDGLRPTQDWQDSVSGAYREFVDSAVVMHAIETSPLTYTDRDRAAIGGWGGTNVNIFNTESRRVVDYIRPDDGTKCAGEASYAPDTNPGGVRCTFQDFMASIFGRDDQGRAPLLFDNVGIQYGLLAAIEGTITVEQFVDLNARAGGFDIDGRWQPERSRMSPELAARLYRTGQITQGRGLARVAILAIRGTNNDDYHYPYRTVVNRARLIAANGHADNHVFWIEPPRNAGADALEAMDRWLAAVEADDSPDDISVKIVRNRPADIQSGCWIDGAFTTDLDRCEATYPHAREPRTMAGDGPSISTMKCQLKPLDRSAYPFTFTDEQWQRMQQAFPEGVCDFSKPGVGVQPTVEWLTYRNGPGGEPLGPPPVSR